MSFAACSRRSNTEAPALCLHCRSLDTKSVCRIGPLRNVQDVRLFVCAVQLSVASLSAPCIHSGSHAVDSLANVSAYGQHVPAAFKAADCPMGACVCPSLEAVLLGGWKTEVWLQPGKEATQVLRPYLDPVSALLKSCLLNSGFALQRSHHDVNAVPGLVNPEI